MPRRPRRAAANMLTLLALPALLLLAGLVIYVGQLRDAHTETQNAADAAALAGARALASEAPNRIERARRDAVELAAANIAAGERVRLDHSDVTFGHLDSPLGTFTPTHGPQANAVRVTARGGRTRPVFGGASRDAPATATAMLDFHVAGFRPTNDDLQPIVPIAILGEPGGDEFNVRLGEGGGLKGAYLRIGVRSFGETALQCRFGIRRRELERESAGDFALGRDNVLNLPGSPDCPADGSEARQLIAAALDALRADGSPRVWQLARNVRHDRVAVTGWVAARVVSVRGDAGGVTLRLRPAVLPVTSAATERRDHPPAFWAANRTVCRVRLAE